MNLTNLEIRGAQTRFALGLVASIVLVPSALAGTYSATFVGWQDTTLTGVAQLAYSGITGVYKIDEGFNLNFGSEYRMSSLVARAKWKITWSPSYPGELPPSQCAVNIATELADCCHASAEAYGGASSDWVADTKTSDILTQVRISHAFIAANAADEVIDEKGSMQPSHCVYYNPVSGFDPVPGTSNYVAYAVADASAWGEVSVSAGGNRRGMSVPGAAVSGVYILGRFRLVTVNGVQIGNDFPGGMWPTTGYSN